MNVKRYTVDESGDLRRVDDGEVVLFADFEALVARLVRVETERDQFALEAKYSARDAARYHFIRSRWQFSDAEVDRRVDADMAADQPEAAGK